MLKYHIKINNSQTEITDHVILIVMHAQLLWIINFLAKFFAFRWDFLSGNAPDLICFFVSVNLQNREQNYQVGIVRFWVTQISCTLKSLDVLQIKLSNN